MITTKILLTEQQMVKSFLAELENRNLPERFFYWFPPSIEAWLDLCSNGAYKNYIRSYELIATHAADLAHRIPLGKVEVISLGSGQGDKDILILKALADAGKDVVYKPTDASQGLLEIACQTAGQENIVTQGIKANITDPTHLQTIIPPKTDGQTRLLMLLGNTLGAFDPENYILTLRNLLALDDFLLVDGEIFAETHTIAGYDNPLNRQFAFSPLASIGLIEADGDLVFETEEDEMLPGLYRLTKHFRANRALTIQLAGRSINVKPDEKIAMNYSGKYSEARFIELIRHRGQLQVLAHYSTPGQNFIMALLTPSQ